jgi:plastocyanin
MKAQYFAFMFLVSWGITLQAAELEVAVTDKDGGAILDTVVMAMPTQNQAKLKKPQKTVVIDQVDKEFVHYVTAIATGTPVQFPNSDDIRHHVYSFSPVKQFELPLYTGTPAQPVIFDKPGVVKLGCNIHDWMVGYLYITDAPYFKTTDNAGKAQLIDLPVGKYDLTIWHPRMESSEVLSKQTTVVSDTAKNTASFQLTLKPELRPRRAPMAIQQGY